MSNAMLLYAYMSDNELIDKVKSGNKPCFEVLIRRHSQSLYRVGRMHGIGHNDVEDILQYTHKAGFQRLLRMDKKVAYRLRLLKLMIQNCLQKVELETDEDHHVQFEPAARAVDHLALANRIDIAKPLNALEKHIDMLPLQLRAVFVLSEIEGLSLKEVAELLFISEAVAKNRLGKARVEMEKCTANLYYHTDVYPFHKSCCDTLVDRVMTLIDAESYHVEKALIPRF
jgi:DNA-directed RNA polymerase specialized sigma24 family protein